LVKESNAGEHKRFFLQLKAGARWDISQRFFAGLNCGFGWNIDPSWSYKFTRWRILDPEFCFGFKIKKKNE